MLDRLLRRTVLTGLLTLLIAVTGTAITFAPPAHAQTSNPADRTYQTFTDADGYQLRYHRFEGGQAGVVFYFDGDGCTNFRNPDGSYIRNMRKQAAARGFDFVFFDQPGAYKSWWNGIDPDRAAKAVQRFVLAEQPAQAQFAGYSGGAEFLARHLMIDGSWITQTSSSVLMIGGGGVAHRTPAAPTAGQAIFHHWVVGDRDSYGATEPAYWSAYEQSAKAHAAYARKGHRVERTVVANTNHLNYHFAKLLSAELDRLESQVDRPATQHSSVPRPASSQPSSPATTGSKAAAPTSVTSSAAPVSQTAAPSTEQTGRGTAQPPSAPAQPGQYRNLNTWRTWLERLTRVLAWLL